MLQLWNGVLWVMSLLVFAQNQSFRILPRNVYFGRICHMICCDWAFVYTPYPRNARWQCHMLGVTRQIFTQLPSCCCTSLGGLPDKASFCPFVNIWGTSWSWWSHCDAPFRPLVDGLHNSPWYLIFWKCSCTSLLIDIFCQWDPMHLSTKPMSRKSRNSWSLCGVKQNITSLRTAVW